MELASNGYLVMLKCGDNVFSLSKNIDGSLCFYTNSNNVELVFRAVSKDLNEVMMHDVFSKLIRDIASDYLISSDNENDFPGDFVNFNKGNVFAGFNDFDRKVIKFHSDENYNNVLSLTGDDDSCVISFKTHDCDNQIVIKPHKSLYNHYYFYLYKLYNDIKDAIINNNALPDNHFKGRSLFKSLRRSTKRI